MYKLIVLDIDGTLTNDEKKISTKTKQSILEIQQRGLKVVIASGRPTCGIIPLARELEFEKYGSYILSYNGGMITNCGTGEVIFSRSLPNGVLKDAYNFAKEFGAEIITYQGNDIISEIDSNKYMNVESKINSMNINNVGNMLDYVNFDVPKCLLLGDGERMGELEPILRERLGESANVFRSEPFFLEVMPAKVDKAQSLARLLEALGLTKEEMIACGDGFNDLTMIEFAGLGVAMENAQDKVKEAADFITLSNNNDGIAYVIYKFMLTTKNTFH